MTASSTSSCTCNLLIFLLPLLLSVHCASCVALPPPAETNLPPCISSMSQFSIDVNYLGDSVNNCSTNCSSLNIPDRTCQCFNVSMSQDCRPLDFILSGLNTLRLRLTDNFTVSSLIKRLKHLSADCKGKSTFCSLHVSSEVLMSPKRFQEKLKSLVEKYNVALRAQ